MSGLRSTILKHSIPLIPKHSFTRQTLLASLPSLNPDHAEYKSTIDESVIDTVFGNGQAASKALVAAWEEHGLGEMQGKDLRERLVGRLRFSAGVGEHLVEAYALMSSPDESYSLPVPRLPLAILRSIKVPKLYHPNANLDSTLHSTAPSSPSPVSPDSMAGMSATIESLSNRIPLIALNPLGSLSYAWRIADKALKLDERGLISKGIMNEPTGSGPEWYSSRISLCLAYLQAESHLLQPYPASILSDQPNPYLDSAIRNMEDHLQRYDSVSNVLDSGSKATGQAMTWFEHVARSAVGIVRNREM